LPDDVLRAGRHWASLHALGDAGLGRPAEVKQIVCYND
jgi:hypothetical protein